MYTGNYKRKKTLTYTNGVDRQVLINSCMRFSKPGSNMLGSIAMKLWPCSSKHSVDKFQTKFAVYCDKVFYRTDYLTRKMQVIDANMLSL